MKLIFRLLVIVVNFIFLITYKFMCLIYADPINKEFKFCYTTSFGVPESIIIYWLKVVVFLLFAITLVFETKIDSVNSKLNNIIGFLVLIYVFFVFLNTLMYEFYDKYLLISSLVFVVLLIIYQIHKLKSKKG